MCDLTEEKIKEVRDRLDNIMCKTRVIEVSFIAAQDAPKDFLKLDSAYYGGMVKISREIVNEIEEIFEII